MTVKQIFLCSMCGAERKEANHWFAAMRSKTGLGFYCWRDANAAFLEDENTLHLCGQQCAHKLLDEFLTGPEKEGEQSGL